MEIYSSTLQQYLRTIIDELPASQKIQLKTLRTCNTKVVKPTIGEGGAFLLKSEDKAKFAGLLNCKNMWACPCCTAKRMSQYAEQFAVAIEEMKSRGYFAFMITLTIPHLAFMKCRETTDILYNVWKYFTNSKNYVGKSSGNVVTKFFNEFQIKHYVSVSEYTWGKNGWHPHFHCIFWVKQGRQQEILDWEKSLSEWWLATCKRETLKYWNKNNLYLNEEWRENKLNKLYTNFKDESPFGLFISKKDDKIVEAKAAWYLAGWGVDKELTKLTEKTPANGHYTPHQILQLAYDGSRKMKKLYIEFCLQVTRKPFHRRVTWSRNGLYEIVKVAMQQEKCRTLLKKKEVVHWELLLWFDKEQWSYINELDKDSPLIANILYLAAHCGKEVLTEFLIGLGLSWREPHEHYWASHIENIYNGKAG